MLQVLLPTWTEKRETAKRRAQRIKAVLDAAKSNGFRRGEYPLKTIRDTPVLPQLKQKAMHRKYFLGIYAEQATKDGTTSRISSTL